MMGGSAALDDWSDHASCDPGIGRCSLTVQLSRRFRGGGPTLKVVLFRLPADAEEEDGRDMLVAFVATTMLKVWSLASRLVDLSCSDSDRRRRC